MSLTGIHIGITDMCRFAAYLGSEISLHDMLLAPEHGLMQQSWEPRELKYAKLNADGFGIGWYGNDDSPISYRQTTPIWSDPNLTTLSKELFSDLWIGFIRSATPGFGTHINNTQPFIADDLIYCHNGYVENFHSSLRGYYLEQLDSDIIADIQGNTDSEWLFAAIRQQLKEDDEISIEAAIAETCREIHEKLNDQIALLNFLITDGERVYATRSAANHESPSLYYCLDNEDFPEGAQLIASEPFDDNGLWQSVPEHHMLILDPDTPPELIAL